MIDELPEGWVLTTIEEICDLNPKHPNTIMDSTPVSFVPMAAVSEVDGRITGTETRNYGAVKRGFTHFADGDVIFAKITPCMENGKAASVRGLVNGLACGTTEFFVFRSRGAVDQDYLFHFIRQESYRRAARATMQSGVGQARVPKEFVINTELPLPPLAEQRRIVAKIEELTARSRVARAALVEVPTLLERFRQSVLASAFRGDLTADWRAKHEHVVAEDWFSKIVGERGPETEKAHLWGSGRTLDEVRPEWGDLPEDWRWVRVKELGFDTKDVVQIGPMSMKSNEFIDSGVTVLNVGCVQRGYLDLSKANFLPSDRAKDFSRYRVTENDIVFTRSGSVGRCSMVPAALHDALITFHLLRVRTSPEICLPEYLLFAFQGAGCVANQIEESSIGATRAGFNTRLLEEMWIPLPPPIEQEVIVTQIREVDSRVSTLLESMTETLETLSSLDQSILAKAFRGELVPQDPADEPASALLERLRNESTANNTALAQKETPRQHTITQWD